MLPTWAQIVGFVSTAPWKHSHMNIHKFSICNLQGFYYVFTSGFPHWQHVTVQLSVIAFNQPCVKHRRPSLSLWFHLSLHVSPPSVTWDFSYHVVLLRLWSVGGSLVPSCSPTFISTRSCLGAPDVRSHGGQRNGQQIRAGDMCKHTL